MFVPARENKGIVQGKIEVSEERHKGEEKNKS